MANVESDRGIGQHVNGLRVLTAATILTGIASGVAIKSAIDFLTSPEQKINQQLLNRIQTINTELSDSGTLGSEGSLLFPRLEVRIPDDPRLKELGQLKNQYDAQTAKIYGEIDTPLEKARFPASIFGPISTLLCLMAIRRRLKEQSIKSRRPK